MHVPTRIWANGAKASKDYRQPRRRQETSPQNSVLTPTVPGAASRAQALAPGTDIGTRDGQKQRWEETEDVRSRRETEAQQG